MPEATAEELKALDPYIAGERPDNRGEINIYCPLHEDAKRSCSINVHKGVWKCHRGCGGGSLRQLVDNEDTWVSANGRTTQAKNGSNGATRSLHLPTNDDIEHWHRRLRREPAVHRRLEERGLFMSTLRRALIGWDGRNYKIPIFGPSRRLWNVRNYTFDPQPGRSKIWNTRGMGEARLYPYSTLENAKLGDRVLFPEGEWDTLMGLQYDVLSITRTDGAGKPWHDDWTPDFAGLKVYLCHDVDDAGEYSDEETVEALSDVSEVYQCHLPYRHKETNGNDLTDYLLEFKPRSRRYMLIDLLESATRLT